MRDRTRLSALFSVALILSPMAGSAEVLVDSTESILFDDLPSVFSASRYEQKINDAPSSVSIVSADDIRRYGYRTLADLLRSVKGLYTSYDRAYTYLGVRGFSPPGDYNTRVLLLVDGYRTNDNIYEQAYLGNESIVPVELIDRVEIIRGPSSSLYGTNAFFAVINVITKRGRDYQGFAFAQEAASFGTARSTLSYGNRDQSGFEGLVSASYYTSDGHSVYFPEYDSPLTNNGHVNHTDSEKVSSWFAKVSGKDLTVTAASIYRSKGMPVPIKDVSFGSRDTHFYDPVYKYIHVRYESELSSNSNFFARIGYNTYGYRAAYAYDPTFREYSIGEWWLGELLYNVHAGDKHKFVFGVEDHLNLRQKQHAEQGGVPILNDTQDSNRWAVFIQDEYKVTAVWLITAGLRYDKYQKFGGVYNPRLSAVQRINKNGAVKLLYGTAFRAPNVYEMYYTDSYSLLPNPDLKPEKISTYEIVLESPIFDKTDASVSLFHYKVSNQIVRVENPITSYSMFLNEESATTDGIELEASTRWRKGFEAKVSYCFLQSSQKSSGQNLSNSPRHSAKINLSSTMWGEKLVGTLETQFISGRRTWSGNYASKYAVTNLSLSSRELISHLEVGFSIYNSFDESYKDPVDNMYDPIAATKQDGRTYRLKLGYEF